jgi:hypothetical protein
MNTDKHGFFAASLRDPFGGLARMDADLKGQAFHPRPNGIPSGDFTDLTDFVVRLSCKIGF